MRCGLDSEGYSWARSPQLGEVSTVGRGSPDQVLGGSRSTTLEEAAVRRPCQTRGSGRETLPNAGQWSGDLANREAAVGRPCRTTMGEASLSLLGECLLTELLGECLLTELLGECLLTEPNLRVESED